MSKQRIGTKIRGLVAERSDHICEYCRVPEFVGLAQYECDHIISEKQGGLVDIENLAYCCQFCNRHKGTNISSYLGNPPELLLLFNPRTDIWDDHFYYTEDGIINAKTPVAKGTIFVLVMNDPLWVERRAAHLKNKVM